MISRFCVKTTVCGYHFNFVHCFCQIYKQWWLKHVTTNVGYTSGLTNIWNKERFPWHAVFTAVLIIFISFAWPVYLYCEEYVCVYTYLTVQRLYELLLPLSNTESETFLYKLGAVWSVDWMFIIRALAWQLLGEYMTLDKAFYNILF